MTPTTTRTTTTADPGLARAGRWCLAAGLVGVAQGAAVLAWPAQVDPGQFSYPLDGTWHVVAQATFFLQHLPLVLVVAALAASPAVRTSGWARRGLLLGATGLALLALMELVAMSAATTDVDSTLGGTIGALYGIPTLLTALGLLAGGVAAYGRRVVRPSVALTVAALGSFVLVGLLPALASGSFVAGRLAIMAWMLLFAVLGALLSRPSAQA